MDLELTGLFVLFGPQLVQALPSNFIVCLCMSCPQVYQLHHPTYCYLQVDHHSHYIKVNVQSKSRDVYTTILKPYSMNSKRALLLTFDIFDNASILEALILHISDLDLFARQVTKQASPRSTKNNQNN